MKSFEALETTLLTILAIAGGVSVITGAIIGLRTLFSGPFKRLKALEQITAKHSKRMEEIEMKNDKRMEEIEETIKVFLMSQKAILEHLISGDGSDELKEASKNIDNHLIERIGH